MKKEAKSTKGTKKIDYKVAYESVVELLTDATSAMKDDIENQELDVYYKDKKRYKLDFPAIDASADVTSREVSMLAVFGATHNLLKDVKAAGEGKKLGKWNSTEKKVKFVGFKVNDGELESTFGELPDEIKDLLKKLLEEE